MDKSAAMTTNVPAGTVVDFGGGRGVESVAATGTVRLEFAKTMCVTRNCRLGLDANPTTICAPTL